MKRLYDYLVEDFKLSKHTKLDSYIFSIDDFNAVQPNKTGDSCLILAYTTAVKPHLEIDLGMYRILDNNTVEFWYTQYTDESRAKATKLTTNYYCVYTHYWVYVLLFDDDALTFLHILLNNQEKDFDASVFTSKITKPLPVMEWKPRLQAYDFYNSSQIERMIKQIKQQNETII